MINEICRELGIPARSRLVSLPPIGIGSPIVESLPSYLHRLATLHCVRLYRLVAHFLPEKRRRDNNGGSLLANWHNDQKGLAQAFSALTCRSDLGNLSLCAWTTLLSPCGLFRRHRAWCPACLAEMRPVYQPLLWNLAPVTCCPRHHQALLTCCPKCGNKLKLWGEACASLICFSCSFNLAETLPSTDMQAPDPWHLWKANACGELLAHRRDVPVNTVSDILDKLLFRVFPTKAAAARATGLGTSFVYTAGKETMTAPLESLLRIAYACGTKPVALLFDDLELLSGRRRTLPEKSFHLRPRYTSAQLSGKIQILLASDPKLTARKATLALGVSSAMLKQKCPKQYGFLVRRSARLAHTGFFRSKSEA